MGHLKEWQLMISHFLVCKILFSSFKYKWWVISFKAYLFFSSILQNDWFYYVWVASNWKEITSVKPNAAGSNKSNRWIKKKKRERNYFLACTTTLQASQSLLLRQAFWGLPHNWPQSSGGGTVEMSDDWVSSRSELPGTIRKERSKDLINKHNNNYKGLKDSTTWQPSHFLGVKTSYSNKKTYSPLCYYKSSGPPKRNNCLKQAITDFLSCICLFLAFRKQKNILIP